jgi:Kdo2-lipid IVA lauroyltransferase/acyltransferase
MAALKRIRYRLEWLGLSLAAKLVPLLSRNACSGLAHFLGTISSIVDRSGWKTALSNLQAAFGSQISPAERKQIARASFQHFAATVIDLLWSPRLSRENISRYVEFENFDEIARSTGPERSFIMACYHYSSFEWLSIGGGYAGIIGTIIAQEFKNPLLDPIFKKIRERPGHEFVPRERGIVRLYKALRRKRTTAMLVDLTVPPGQGAVIIDCFGLKTSVTSAPAWLHEGTGAPIIPAHCEPLPHGRYRVVFHPRIETTPEMTHQEITQACWDSFEPYVRKNPAPWLWMYKHWRYRPAKDDRAYPFYANVSERFDDLLAMQAGIPIPGRRKKRHLQFDRAQRRGSRSPL